MYSSITSLRNRLIRYRLSNNSISTSSKLRKNERSTDYQFIEKSKVPTYHFQKSLPRLPIPELSKTCERYLAAQAPILSTGEFEDTKKLVKEFENDVGKVLDAQLRAQDSANKHTSYIAEPWFDMYLRDRVPLPFNYNPALVFVNSPPPLDNQLLRTTNMVVSSLRFMKSLRAGILAPEVFHLNPAKSDNDRFRNVVRMLPSAISWYGAYLFKAYPLDMSQYSSLFNSTRIPKRDKDVLFRNDSARHLLVLRKGHFYKFDVLDKSGNILPAEEILACFRCILSQNLTAEPNSVGALTGWNRYDWAETRNRIITKSAGNAQAFNDIDSALFAVCLDDDPCGDDVEHTFRKFLHGDSTNRWFDKSFSLIVASDGTAGVNFEHSWGDGVAVLRYFQDILKDSNANQFVTNPNANASAQAQDSIQEIKFDLTDEIKSDITKAKSSFDSVCKEMKVSPVQLTGFGKKDCKKAKVSPDSIMQLSFQVAYHKVYDNFVATYESCSTAAFKHGRTETVRPCTSATKKFALAFNTRNQPSRQEIIQMMQNCSAVHGELTKNAAMGNGFDRHLFALRLLAGKSLPSIFTDPAYAKINHNILSTSTLASDSVLLGGFGPVVKDGLGVGYSILDNNVGSLITSYPPHRNGADFAEALEATLKEFSAIIAGKEKQEEVARVKVAN